MDEFIRIAILDNEFEAQILEYLLNENEIPHLIKSYHDSAYNGLFQFTMGWGHLEAFSKHKDKIMLLLEQLRQSINISENDSDENPHKKLR